MQDRPEPMGIKPSSQSEAFKNSRRQLLRMGAAGMPMVLTLRASASEAVISQLTCSFTVPSDLNILVDDEGSAWVSKDDIDSGPKGLKIQSLEKFKEKADYVYPAGTVPKQYRPDECEECDDYGYSLRALESDFAAYTPQDTSDMYGYTASDNLGRSKGDKKNHCKDDKKDKKDKKHNQWIDCGYTLYNYGANHSITPGNYVENGNFSIQGDDGLYLALSLVYADEYGNVGNWPGISCIVSVLNYIGH